MAEPDWLTTAQAGKHLGVDPRVVIKRVNVGPNECVQWVPKATLGTLTSMLDLIMLASLQCVSMSSYDPGVAVTVDLQRVTPRKMAAVRREVEPGAVGSAWRPAVGLVWNFIRSQSGLWTDGHNIFLYHHAKQLGSSLLCDFGVEVTRTFEPAGEVYATETPGGEAAVAVYRGPYDQLNLAYVAIDSWMAANHRESAGHSWEIYGDPTPNPANTKTTVLHLLT